MVSVSTDDQGVFDTSLENECALLAAALAAQRREDGTRIYSNDAIYSYLEHLQTLGQLQIFPAAFDPSCALCSDMVERECSIIK